ncbi:MAG TPA: AAA family ATPase [Candidatus Kapabacteria bacterium]|nr:AAA family ATPase [Candidatus Kapabacteria bacterium]
MSLDAIKSIRQFIKDEAERFGAKTSVEYNKPYVERNNTGAEALEDNGAYFGFIHPAEDISGPFHDFSLTIFPSADDKAWLVCLGIGSMGFKNDFELASFPGVRRLFSRFIDEEGYCKSNFSDIETSLPKSITQSEKLQHLKSSIQTYTKVLPVCQIVDDPESSKGRSIISAFVAGYAKIRNWPSNKSQRKAIDDSIKPFMKDSITDEEVAILQLLEERKYIVLQGPPGSGKTRLAKMVAEKIKADVFFTQFHAETSYSDFIYGLRPKVSGNEIGYDEVIGPLPSAIQNSINSGKKTILIIDEINRANLSNVLGPSFYLFEYRQDLSNVNIPITPSLTLQKLPENFYVIATMNTADRSLAVVDFALRRRFAWYTLKPRAINSKLFFSDDFNNMSSIFEWYASSNELPLQPGQGYFMSNDEAEMKRRVRYELYPLIQEYLREGLMRNAKEEFNDYFLSRIGLSIFE